MNMENFESEFGQCMDSLPTKKPLLAEVWDCIERSLGLIDVYQRGPNWRGS